MNQYQFENVPCLLANCYLKYIDSWKFPIAIHTSHKNLLKIFVHFYIGLNEREGKLNWIFQQSGKTWMNGGMVFMFKPGTLRKINTWNLWKMTLPHLIIYTLQQTCVVRTSAYLWPGNVHWPWNVITLELGHSDVWCQTALTTSNCSLGTSK